MKVPFLSNRVGDMLIYALRAGGFLADETSANAVRGVSANATEAEMSALAATLNYGAIGDGSLSSKTSAYVFIDSDGVGDTSPYTDSFVVGKGQSAAPISTASHYLFGIDSQSDPELNKVIARIGPPGNMVYSGTYETELYLGYTHAIPFAQPLGYLKSLSSGLTLYGREDVTIQSGLGDMQLQATNGLMDVHLNSNLHIYDSASNLAAGFKIGTGPSVFISDKLGGYTYLTNDELVVNAWSIYASNASDVQKLYIRGYPNSPIDDQIRVVIGVSPGTYYNPDSFFIGGNPPPQDGAEAHSFTSMIIAPDTSYRHCALYVRSRGTSFPINTHLVNFASDVDSTGGNPKIRLFSVSAMEGVQPKIMFAVRANKSVYADNITSTPLDVAECFPTSQLKEHYAPGSVLCMDQDGTIAASVNYADPKVIGVVSTEPGVTLGAKEDGSQFDGYFAKVALAGTVPVKVTAEYGEIGVGDLLVSAPGGLAAKAPAETKAGTIIGKAMENLETYLGTIKMLVMSR